MRVLIVGYGRMGHEIELALNARGHVVAGRVDPRADGADAPGVTEALLGECDVVIEFSLPAAIRDNATKYAKAGVPAVVGTTGWEEARDDISAVIEGNSGSLIWGNNFSIGANLFGRTVAAAARMFDEFDGYDLFIHEYHHNRKKDSPSGTAISLALRLIESIERKTTIVTDRLDRAPAPEELHVSSTRGGSVPGTHTVSFDSEADTIELTHRARNRSGFAAGAVRAAEWIVGRTGFFSVDDFFDDLLGNG